MLLMECSIFPTQLLWKRFWKFSQCYNNSWVPPGLIRPLSLPVKFNETLLSSSRRLYPVKSLLQGLLQVWLITFSLISVFFSLVILLGYKNRFTKYNLSVQNADVDNYKKPTWPNVKGSGCHLSVVLRCRVYSDWSFWLVATSFQASTLMAPLSKPRLFRSTFFRTCI